MCRRIFDIFLYFFFCVLLYSCNSDQDFENFLLDLSEFPENARSIELEKYLSKFESFPLINDTTVYFILKEEKDLPVYLTGDMNRWQPKLSPLFKIIGTNYYYRKETFPADARLEYKFIINENYTLDSLNHLKSLGGFGYNSLLLMPDYEFPDEVLGKRLMEYTRIDTIVFESIILNNSRRVYFYDHPLSAESSPIIMLLDGSDYLNLANANVTLDNLISENKIPAIKAVFIDPVDRMKEFWLNEPFLDMIFKELIPFLNKKYALTDNHVFMGGVSLGGVSSFFALKDYSRNLTGCFSQSGAFWIDSLRIVNELSSVDIGNKLLYLSYGTFENQDSVHLVLKKFMDKKRADYKVEIYNEGHNWGNWKSHLDNALIFLLDERKEI